MSYTTNSCYDCCLVYPSYSCIYTPYNDPSFYETLAASGKIGLGTVDTDRSINIEFGGSAPHGISEYSSCGGATHTGDTRAFSDFYGTSVACNPPVTNALWTHYDFSGCSTGEVSAVCTTSAAAEQQCLRVACANVGSYTYTDQTACICTLVSNGISNNYLYGENHNTFYTCAGNAYWGDTTAPYDNSVFLVFKRNTLGYYHIIRFNTGYCGYLQCYYGFIYPFYAGHMWQDYNHGTFMGQCRYLNLIVYGSDKCNWGQWARGNSCTSGATQVLSNFDAHIWGHRINIGCVSGALDSDQKTCWQFNFKNCSQTQASFDSACCTWASTAGQYWQRCAGAAGGKDFFNGHYYYAATCYLSRISQCFAIGEYLHYCCRLTDTEWNNTFTYLINKWSVTGGTGNC
tara:strand:- start:3439 stop:4641 length:1203 start_codon:yes stop_codon:yes gene_type:complete